MRFRSPPTAGGGFNCLACFALPRFRAMMQLLFLQGSASCGDCPRKALVTARGAAGLPQEHRLVAQIYSIQRTIPRNTFFIYGSKNFPVSLPAPAGFSSVRSRAMLPRQAGAPHGVCMPNRLFKKITLPRQPYSPYHHQTPSSPCTTLRGGQEKTRGGRPRRPPPHRGGTKRKTQNTKNARRGRRAFWGSVPAAGEPPATGLRVR